MTQDGKAFRPDWAGKFQRVIADVPCSGLGIIRKKPDIRYKDPKPLEHLPQVQKAILDNVSRYVAPGGVLLYSTCTVLERENEGVVRDFLSRHPEFRLEEFPLPGPTGEVSTGMITLWPHIHGTDGFFIARLRRDADETGRDTAR
jgi:16S rRNA (cytosine967-C5)-methyltransferase